MITIFVRNCYHISQSFYDSVISGLPFHKLTCSCSHSACLSIHGYYKRTVKLPSGTIRLRVCRVKCSECGITHSLLLSSMVPYSQITLSDQQRICSDYESGRNVSMICNSNPSIDENNVKSVLRNYRHHWREKLRSLRIRLFDLYHLVRSCFSDYSSQFMQIRRRVNKLFSYTT
jgi:transposase